MTPLFAGLEVIDDPRPHGAAFNMAADEALLETIGDDPLLRIYRWERPSVSFGYFDQAGAVVAAFPGRDHVRRWTGGGVVEHGEDFTYSLLVPRTQALTALRAEKSYRVLHEVLARALSAAGAAPPVLQDDLPAPASADFSRSCFVNPVPHDLLSHGRKIAGAAQRRTRRGWLHQGSVQGFRDASSEIFAQLGYALPSALGKNIWWRDMRPQEEDAAHALTRRKYGTDAWLRRF